MALTANVVWETRTTGATTNGGYYDSSISGAGTDYSRQDAAQLSITDGATSAANATITSATAGFTAAMIGNGLYIASGTNFTVGWYTIIGYDSSTTITVDRTCASAAASGGVIAIGGATNHPNTVAAVVVAGNTIYIQEGTYQKVGSNDYVLDTAVAGSSGTPIIWYGYTGSRAEATGTARPSFDGNSNTAYGLRQDASNNVYKNIIFKNATSHGVYSYASSASVFYNCRFTANTTDGLNNSGGSVRAMNCEFDANGSDGVDLGTTGNSPTIFAFCYFHNNTARGANFGGTTIFVNCISESNSSHGFAGTAAFCINCIAYNNTGASTHGFYWNINTSTVCVVVNNIAQSNGQYGFARVNSAAAFLGIFDYNLYNGNGTAGLSSLLTAGAHDVTSNPLFNDPTTGDFTVNPSSPAVHAGLADDTTLLGNYNWNIGYSQQGRDFTWGAGTISQDTADARSGTCVKFNPLTTTGQLGWRFYVPCTASTAFVVKLYVKKSSSAANCTFTFSASGSGITPIVDASVSLTDTYAQYTSSSMTPTSSGFVEIVLKATDGSTTGDIFVDDITVE